MTEINMYKIDSYLHQLERMLDQETIEECKNFMSRIIKHRHNRVLKQQKRKFEALVQQKTNDHSKKDVQKNRDTDNNNEDKEREERKKWVINLSSTPLTDEQKTISPWAKVCDYT